MRPRLAVASFSLALCALCARPAVVRADIIFTNFGSNYGYDVTEGNPVGNFSDGNNYAEGETFTPTANASVTQILVALSEVVGTSNTDALTLSLTTDSGSDSPGAVLASVTIPVGSLGELGANNAPYAASFASVALTAGTQYWVTVSDPDGLDTIAWNNNNTGDSADQAISQDGGNTWFSPSGQTPGAFEVDGTPAQVVAPEPGSLALLGSGAFALLGGRWRRLRRHGLQRTLENRPGKRPQIEELEDRNMLTGTPPGTWAPVTSPMPDFAGTMQLLTNGQIMVQGYTPGNNFYLLTPDSTGSYINGTWSSTAPMSTTRLYYSSNILSNGNLFILGGEYSDSNYDQNSSNTGQIYDPATDTWGPVITNFPQATYGDEPSMLLPNGTSVLVSGGDTQLGFTYIFNSLNGQFTGPIPKVYENYDSNDEEGWTKLPNGNVLTYDLFTSVLNNGQYAEEFNTQTNTWFSISPSDGSANGSIPVLSSEALGFELGPQMLLQNGSVLVIGATDNTALYNPVTNTWTPGPRIIGTLNGQPAAFGSDDAPAAELPDGNVIFAADAGPTLGTFDPPAELFEYNAANNTISQLSPPLNDGNLPLEGAYPTRLLALPTGQILFDDSSDQLYVFTPDDTSPVSVRPVVNSVTYNGSGVFTLTGKQLNGQSSGSMYGDDVESDENYPIVSFKNATTGVVYYGRTFNWSTTGVQTGTLSETVNFTLPAGMPAGNYLLTESGAGIGSLPHVVNISASETSYESGPVTQPGSPPLLGADTPSPIAIYLQQEDSDGDDVSFALSHSGVGEQASPSFNLSTHTSAQDGSTVPQLTTPSTLLIQEPSVQTITTTQVSSNANSTTVLDALFADYSISPF